MTIAIREEEDFVDDVHSGYTSRDDDFMRLTTEPDRYRRWLNPQPVQAEGLPL
ncbi:MAG: hypothetical protein HY663_03995 [Chloroflexi bacterium]|nr:hypothetical protein [Chloroflexota bacterium]